MPKPVTTVNGRRVTPPKFVKEWLDEQARKPAQTKPDEPKTLSLEKQRKLATNHRKAIQHEELFGTQKKEREREDARALRREMGQWVNRERD